MVTIMLTRIQGLFVVPIMVLFLQILDVEAGTMVAEYSKLALTDNQCRGDLFPAGRGDSNFRLGGEIQL